MSGRARPVVAIDGPAGAGKSTVTRVVAERLGYHLINTGAIYRALALAAQRAGFGFHEAEPIGELAHELVKRGAIQLVPADGIEYRVMLDGEDVSSAIRSQVLGEGASKVSAIPAVRDALLELQRTSGRAGGVVLEGRDIGTVVFPDAEAKFFLTASVDVRAKRRHDELVGRGSQAPTLEDVRREVIERDRRDSSRPVAPLMQAPDAQVLDSSALDIEQVADRIVLQVRAIEQRLARSGS
ncbi:MAG TPA: (d)CMP kinase [Polyangiaceae bacterium]|nr:(d)CMP kinase [Polyangiaceae bacterium]